MIVMKKKILHKVITYLAKYYLNIPSKDEVLHIREGQIFYKGRKISDEERRKLILDANTYKNSLIFKLINGEVKAKGQDLVFNKSQTVDDMIVGKTMIYVANIQQSKLEDLAELEK